MRRYEIVVPMTQKLKSSVKKALALSKTQEMQ